MLHVTSLQALIIDPPQRSIPRATYHVRAGISGFPSPAQDYDGGRVDLNEQLIPRPTSTFMFTAEGDSMQCSDGSGIHGGDKLLVDRAIDARHGDIVVAVVDGELLVKELRCRGCTRPIRAMRLSWCEALNTRSGMSAWLLLVQTFRCELHSKPKKRSVENCRHAIQQK